MKHGLSLLSAFLLWGCSVPPHIVLTVEDPLGVAVQATSLRVSYQGESIERDLEGKSLPVTITITKSESPARELIVEALAPDGTTVALGKTAATFVSGRSTALTVQLQKVCFRSPDCDDGMFCNGYELCIDGLCTPGEDPCPPSPFECVGVSCIEDMQFCTVDVDHSLCGTVPTDDGGTEPTYCDSGAGCVRGAPCYEATECDNGLMCDGVERCVAGRCQPGLPLEYELDPCKLSGCVEGTGVVEIPDPTVDGRTCVRADESEGVCVSGNCAVSRCGDGFLDIRREECEELDQSNPNDGCYACKRTKWEPTVISGLGPSGGDPAELGVSQHQFIKVSKRGDVFLSDLGSGRVYRIDRTTKIATIYAGTTNGPSAGDDGPATSATLDQPAGIAIDGKGNLFIAEKAGHRVRRVDILTGVITTVAGTGIEGSSGDGGLATRATLTGPTYLAVDGLGNLFISCTDHRVRRVDAETGIITTYAGNGVQALGGDGGPAVDAEIDPGGLAVGPDGDLFIADLFNRRVRRVDAETGIITTFAGLKDRWTQAEPDALCELGPGASQVPFLFSGQALVGCCPGAAQGSGGPATNAPLRIPADVTFDSNGDLFIADEGCRIWKVDLSTNEITAIAGTGASIPFDQGLGSQARNAVLSLPSGIAVDLDGQIYISYANLAQVHEIDAQTMNLELFAGTAGAIADVFGDGTLATTVRLAKIEHDGVALDSKGNIYVAHNNSLRIRKVDAVTGLISTVAGNGQLFTSQTLSPRPATGVSISTPWGIAIDDADQLYLSNFGNALVDKVDLATGMLNTVAGTGDYGFSGDGGIATAADISVPAGLAIDTAGDLLIADLGNYRVRKVRSSDRIINTIAGIGLEGYAGDGGAATDALFYTVQDTAVDAAGNIYIADEWGHTIRRVDAGSGVVTTFAGTGYWPGYAGDGGPARHALLNYPTSLTFDGDGNLYVADKENHVVRRIDPSGTITTVAGNGLGGFSGDGGPATKASLAFPNGVAASASGQLYIVVDDAVRKVDLQTGKITTAAGRVRPEGDGVLARSSLGAPTAFARFGANQWLVADGDKTNRVRLVDLDNGEVRSVAGYKGGFAAENAEAFYSRLLENPAGIAFDPVRHHIYVSERRGHVIRRIDASTAPWTISTFAGVFDSPGFKDGTIREARFNGPSGLVFDEGTRALLIADSQNHVVRSVAVDSPGATVTVIAGRPESRGFFGEDTDPLQALLDSPEALLLGPDGSLYIADRGNHRVRRIDPEGKIHTVLGDGTSSSSGTGKPARLFSVNAPRGLALDRFGNLFVSSRTAVRVVVADEDGIPSGAGEVRTIFGSAPREIFPEPVTFCLTGLQVVDGAGSQDRILVLDECQGFLIELNRTSG